MSWPAVAHATAHTTPHTAHELLVWESNPLWQALVPGLLPVISNCGFCSQLIL